MTQPDPTSELAIIEIADFQDCGRNVLVHTENDVLVFDWGTDQLFVPFFRHTPSDSALERLARAIEGCLATVSNLDNVTSIKRVVVLHPEEMARRVLAAIEGKE